MSAPVEAEHHGGGGWTMEFLYVTTDDGPTGTDGRVVVRDVETMTVLALGMRGGWRVDAPDEAVRLLLAWLDGRADWARAGDVRLLGYNGPNVRMQNQWWEVQIPIRRIPIAGD